MPKRVIDNENPVNNIIQPPAADNTQKAATRRDRQEVSAPQPLPADLAADIAAIEKKYGISLEKKRAKKTARIQLAVPPDALKTAKAIAKKQHLSLNEYMLRLMEADAMKQQKACKEE